MTEHGQFSYPEDRIIAGGGCEVAVTSTKGRRCEKYIECQNYIVENNSSLKVIYRSCMIQQSFVETRHAA